MRPARLVRFLLALVLYTEARAVNWEDWQTLMNEADHLAGEGQFRQALPLAGTTVEMARQAGPGEGRLADSLDLMGHCFLSVGQYLPAEKALLEAITISSPLPGHQPRRAQALGHLALLYRETGRPAAEVESLSRQALGIAEVSTGRDAPAVAALLSWLAICLIDRKNHKEARVTLQRALQMTVESRNPAFAAELYLSFGSLAYHEGKYLQALEALDHASLLMRQIDRSHDVAQVLLLVSQGAVYLKLKRAQEADHAFEIAAEAATNSYGPGHVRLAEILSFRAQSLRQLGKRKEAGQVKKQAQAIVAAREPEVHAVNSRMSFSSAASAGAR